MSYKIITDSCCDFTDQECAELDITYVPLIVTYNGESHTNFSQETAIKAFYDELRGGVTAIPRAGQVLWSPFWKRVRISWPCASPPVFPLRTSPP